MIEIVQSFAALDRIKSEWNALAELFPSPLLLHEWFSSAAKAFCPDEERLRIVAYRTDDGRLSAIAPLMVSNSARFPRLVFIGSEELGEPSGFLYDSPHSLSALMDGLLTLKTPIRLSRMAAGGAEADTLKSISPLRGMTLAKNAVSSPYLSIAPGRDWPAFEASLTASRRGRLNRKRRQAAAYGELSVKMLRPGPKQWRTLFAELLRVEAANWKGRAGSAISLNPPHESFFASICSSLSPFKKVLFPMLLINGRPAAIQMCLLHANALWVLKIGYDEAFANCSPGFLLTHECVRFAYLEGLKSVEFLGEVEQWMETWTAETHAYCTANIYSISSQGLSGFAADASDRLIKSARRAVEGCQRRADSGDNETPTP